MARSGYTLPQELTAPLDNPRDFINPREQVLGPRQTLIRLLNHTLVENCVYQVHVGVIRESLSQIETTEVFRAYRHHLLDERSHGVRRD